MQEIISNSAVGTAPVAHFVDLQARLVDYASRIGELGTPNDVLDALHAFTIGTNPDSEGGNLPEAERRIGGHGVPFVLR
jgi:hypothetical protein